LQICCPAAFSHEKDKWGPFEELEVCVVPYKKNHMMYEQALSCEISSLVTYGREMIFLICG